MVDQGMVEATASQLRSDIPYCVHWPLVVPVDCMRHYYQGVLRREGEHSSFSAGEQSLSGTDTEASH